MADNKSCSWRTEYDIFEALSTYYGIYIVGKSGKMGVIRLHSNNAMEYAIPIEYDEIRIFFKNDYLLLAQKQNKKRIIKVTKNNTVLSPYYDKIGTSITYVGLIQVSIDDLVGAIDTNLKEIIPVQYDMLDDCAFHCIEVGKWRHTVLVMKKGDKWGIIKTTGEVLLNFEYDKIDETIYRRVNLPQNKKDFVILPNQTVSGSGLIPVKKNKKWGLIDEVNFKEVVPCIYKSIRQNTPNKIVLFEEIGYDLLTFTKNGFRIESETTVNLKQYSKIGEFEDGLAVVQKNGKFGFVNEEYKEIAPCIYDEIDSFIHGLSIVRIGEMYGAINNEGKITIPLEYPILIDLSIWGPTMLMAVKNNRFGVVDKSNKTIVPFEFDLVQAMFGMIIVTKNGKKGLYNHKGELVIPIKYDDIAQPSNKSQTYSVCNAGKWGVINRKEEIIIPIEYDGVSLISSGYMYSVCKVGKWGILNKKGENITPFIYDTIDKDGFGFACGRLPVCRNGKWGFINRNGHEVIKCIYDEIYQFFEEKHCEVKLDGIRITIDTNGNQVR